LLRNWLNLCAFLTIMNNCWKLRWTQRCTFRTAVTFN